MTKERKASLLIIVAGIIGYFVNGGFNLDVDFKGGISQYQQAKVQLELSSKLISSQKQLLEEALKLVGS